MAVTVAKYKCFRKKDKWEQKCIEEEKIMVLSAEVTGLKGELKPAKNLEEKSENDNKKIKKDEEGREKMMYEKSKR